MGTDENQFELSIDRVYQRLKMKERIYESTPKSMKTKNDKTVNTRIPQETWEWLVHLTGTAGGSIRAIIFEAKRAAENGTPPHKIADNLLELQIIRRRSQNELKGIFAPAEWSLMADSLNGSIITPEFRCAFSALVISIRDSDEYDGLGAKWGVNIKELCGKIEMLTSAQIDAIFTRVEEFWEDENRNLEKWSIW